MSMNEPRVYTSLRYTRTKIQYHYLPMGTHSRGQATAIPLVLFQHRCSLEHLQDFSSYPYDTAGREDSGMPKLPESRKFVTLCAIAWHNLVTADGDFTPVQHSTSCKISVLNMHYVMTHEGQRASVLIVGGGCLWMTRNLIQSSKLAFKYTTDQVQHATVCHAKHRMKCNTVLPRNTQPIHHHLVYFSLDDC